MHEVSIAQSILEIAVREARKEGYERIEVIRVAVGGASGVLPEALLFAFDAVKLGGPADDAALEIERVPLGGRCGGCGETFSTSEAYILSCPACGSADLAVERGRELNIIDIEVA